MFFFYFQVTCYCGRPFAGRPMIECSRCLTWLHLKCAKLTRQRIPETWFCQRCKTLKGNDDDAVVVDRKATAAASIKKNLKGKKIVEAKKSIKTPPTFPRPAFNNDEDEAKKSIKTSPTFPRPTFNNDEDEQAKVTGSRKRKLTSRRRKITSSETSNNVAAVTTTFSQEQQHSTKSRRLSFELSNDA
jgi:hypothetical protein